MELGRGYAKLIGPLGTGTRRILRGKTTTTAADKTKARVAQMGRNPATGEPIQIKASKKIAFRPAKELKEAI